MLSGVGVRAAQVGDALEGDPAVAVEVAEQFGVRWEGAMDRPGERHQPACAALLKATRSDGVVALDLDRAEAVSAPAVAVFQGEGDLRRAGPRADGDADVVRAGWEVEGER